MAIEIKDQAQFNWIWNNNGIDTEGKLIPLADTLTTQNAPMFMPRVITNIVREAAEPLLVGTSLLQKINYTAGQQITFGALGAITAADIAEGEEYPERSITTSSGTTVHVGGKSGLALKVTEEMVRWSQYDVIGIMLRAAGRALARHKEMKIFNMIRREGTTVFDNLNPTASTNGVCTGRDVDGSPNGSCTMDDVFDCFARVITQGWVPDTILMHPLSWIMWVKDPTLRAFALAAGGGSFYAGWNGSPAAGNPWGAQQGGMGMSGQPNLVPGGNPAGLAASPLTAYPQTLTVSPMLPNYFGIPFRIIVSPLVHFEPRKMLTDIYMFNAQELGALVVAEDIVTEEFNDPRVDIKKIKLRERYALAILNEGQAIGKMKNVHVVPNRVMEFVRPVLNASGTLAPIDSTATVL